MSASVPQPLPGQTRPEIEAWRDAKWPNGRDDWERAYAFALYRSRPKFDDDPAGNSGWYDRLSGDQRAVLEEARRLNALARDEKDRCKFRDRYKLTDDESRAYWKWRSVPRFPGEAQSEWERIKNRLQKKLKAKPRVNADKSKMTPEERKEHRRKQLNEAKKKQRIKKKAEKEAIERAKAIAAGEVVATEEELAKIELAAQEREALSDGLASLLASLRAAEKTGEEEDANASHPSSEYAILPRR